MFMSSCLEPSTGPPRDWATVGKWWKLWKPERGWMDRRHIDSGALVWLSVKPSEFQPALTSVSPFCSACFLVCKERPECPLCRKCGKAEGQCRVSQGAL